MSRHLTVICTRRTTHQGQGCTHSSSESMLATSACRSVRNSTRRRIMSARQQRCSRTRPRERRSRVSRLGSSARGCQATPAQAGQGRPFYEPALSRLSAQGLHSGDSDIHGAVKQVFPTRCSPAENLAQNGTGGGISHITPAERKGAGSQYNVM